MTAHNNYVGLSVSLSTVALLIVLLLQPTVAAVELTVLVLLGQNVTLDCSEYENPAVLWAVDGVFIHPLVEYPGVQIHAIDPDLLTFAMTNFSANETEFSCSKTHWKILIAGPPLPPAPSITLSNATALSITWEKPFTFKDIQSYHLTINWCEQDQVSEKIDFPANGRSLIVYERGTSDGNVAERCWEVTVEVTAESVAGTSLPGSTTHPGFPIAPKWNSIAPPLKLNVTSHAIDSTVYPAVMCNNQPANYTLVVTNANNTVMISSAPVHRLYQEDGDSFNITIFSPTSELTEGEVYIATIILDPIVEGLSKLQYSDEFTCCTSEDMPTTEPDNQVLFYSVLSGAIVAFFLLVVVVGVLSCVISHRLTAAKARRVHMLATPVRKKTPPIYETVSNPGPTVQRPAVVTATTNTITGTSNPGPLMPPCTRHSSGSQFGYGSENTDPRYVEKEWQRSQLGREESPYVTMLSPPGFEPHQEQHQQNFDFDINGAANPLSMTKV